MMRTLQVAARNVLRNGRRSLTTVIAIAVGAISVVLFGGFVTFILQGLQTGSVASIGHLHVTSAGYFLFGTGNPGAFGIPDTPAVIRAILDDPELKPLVRVATPRLTLFGIAGNFSQNVSKTFLGSGFVPSDQERMAGWNDYRLPVPARPRGKAFGLADGDVEAAVAGIGLARVLRLCEALHLADCGEPPPTQAGSPSKEGLDLMTLAEGERAAGTSGGDDPAPRIDLLAATSGGAPNVVTVKVARAINQGIKELDDAYVGMHFKMAERLVYGRGEGRATAIVLQLHHTDQMPDARRRLAALFAERGWRLEVRDFTELWPMYNQVIGMFNSIFGFIAALMGVIVLFTVINTMNMAVVERTGEIGTLRALGVRRSGVRWLFLAEGAILGVLGATLGVVVGIALAALVNRSGLTWTPPSNVEPVPLLVLTSDVQLLGGCWLGLSLLATFSALFPANRAARLTVVDALRHL